ncbi:hypothetical protein GCM10010425_20380 [Streptomyces spororaveus]|uniref:Uncharacterized protein n=1 Tax=Streptomyces spororaveus TaxID=284039 RepID=A0ABQ3T7B6_9ACTN|nr:hypothetical protein [Streptomyces spororaveus]GHI76269.1 hypothetical protein Sspor_18300 [Streptomyces spororaveus]
MIVSFRVRPQTTSRYKDRSSGGPLSAIARSVHAELYGLPKEPAGEPPTLSALLDAAHTANSHWERAHVLHELVAQLPQLAEILDLTAAWARRRHDVPAHTAQWLADTAALTHLSAAGLEQIQHIHNTPIPPPSPSPAGRNNYLPAPSPRRSRRAPSRPARLRHPQHADPSDHDLSRDPFAIRHNSTFN